jgi:preprotein translocase subunit SecD
MRRLALVALVLTLAGCSDDGDDPAATTTAPPSELTADEAAAVLAFQPVLAVQRGPDCAVGELADEGLCHQVGPVAVDARAIESAEAGLDTSGSEWQVSLVFRPDDPGIDTFNEVAASCFAADPTCPTGQVAILSDGEVLSAPSFQQAVFERDGIQIIGDFTQQEAEDLADRLSP